MSKLSKAESERGQELSEWAEGLDGIPEDAVVIRGKGHHPGRGLLEAALGSSKAVDRAMGRPSLDGGTGKSPVRQVRLPHGLDALLVERAEAEQLKPSEIVREALYAYLTKAS
ncbi:MAG TPA: hypothetical protein VFC57_01485 [Aeromicrobium sp.]|nr:hypothetical protein [Aeromicrobium sp.]